MEMYDFKCVYNFILLLVFLLSLLDNEKNEDMKYRIGRRVVNLLFYFVVWLIGRRFKRSFAYWIPVVLIFTRFMGMMAAEAASKSTDDNEEKLKILGDEISSAVFDMAVFFIVLTPSLSFIVFFYFPAFSGFLIYCLFFYGVDGDETLLTDSFVVRLIAIFVFSSIAAYLLQKRELKRFLQQQDIARKEQIASKKE